MIPVRGGFKGTQSQAKGGGGGSGSGVVRARPTLSNNYPIRALTPVSQFVGGATATWTHKRANVTTKRTNRQTGVTRATVKCRPWHCTKAALLAPLSASPDLALLPR